MGVLALQRLAGNRSTTTLLDRHRREDAPVQRTVLVASSPLGMAADVQALAAGWSAKEAYTLLQHLDWALGFAGPGLVDFGAADLAQASSPLLVIAHGDQGKVGSYDGIEIATKLDTLPQGWTGKIFITSCYAGLATAAGNDAVVDVVRARLAHRAPAVTVHGYTGQTITHRAFGNRLQVVLDEPKWQTISDNAERDPVNQRKLGAWLMALQAKPPQNAADLVKLARDTAVITEQIYRGLIADAAKQPGTLSEETIA